MRPRWQDRVGRPEWRGERESERGIDERMDKRMNE
jgi:hypothetical protein